MVEAVAFGDKLERFAPTPWTREAEEWLALAERVSPDHLARRVDEAVAWLDLRPWFDSYLGVGKKALRPDRLFKLAIDEMQNHRPSPAQWARDVRACEPVRWLLLGMAPSRARLYDFRDRIARFLPEWNAQVLRMAVQAKRTPAPRVALDSSSVAAHASRRQLLNAERLAKRRSLIDLALEHLAEGAKGTERPGWLANSADGLREPKQRYRHAAAVLRERQATNAHRRSCKRKPPDQVMVSPTDPDAVLARDKLNVFRPLYNVQLVRDLDAPLVWAYDVLTPNNGHGVVEPLIAQMADQVGRKPDELLVDSGYVSMRHLEFCAQAGITVYGPCQENDYSVQNGKKTQCNQKTELPKSAFRWLPEAESYPCPEGHRLPFRAKQTQQRADYSITLNLYTCPADHCVACPRQKLCRRSPHKGRTVSRMENEELLDSLRARMQTDDAQRLYKLRSRTVELNYADMKEHRGLRRFHGRGLSRAKAEAGVLAHKILFIQEQHDARSNKPSEPKTLQTPCAA